MIGDGFTGDRFGISRVDISHCSANQLLGSSIQSVLSGEGGFYMSKSFLGAEKPFSQNAGNAAVTAFQVGIRKEMRGQDNDRNLARSFACSKFIQHGEAIHFR